MIAPTMTSIHAPSIVHNKYHALYAMEMEPPPLTWNQKLWMAVLKQVRWDLFKMPFSLRPRYKGETLRHFRRRKSVHLAHIHRVAASKESAYNLLFSPSESWTEHREFIFACIGLSSTFLPALHLRYEKHLVKYNQRVKEMGF